jgi:lactam utilization protein B
VCVHGDNPEAVAFVTAVRTELLKSGAELRPFA